MIFVLFVKPCGYFSRSLCVGLSRGDSMGYRIEYGPDRNQVEKGRGTTDRIRAMIAGWLLLFCLLVSAFWPEGSTLLQDVLLPGEKTASEVAFCSFVENLRLGEPLGESVAVFCRTVILDGLEHAD